MAMIELLQKDKGVSRLDAYALASMTMDCRVGEMDAAEKRVHCLVAKSMWNKRRASNSSIRGRGISCRT
jgi:acetamidase/formamidase